MKHCSLSNEYPIRLLLSFSWDILYILTDYNLYTAQAESELRHRVKNSWMYKDELLFLENKAQQMELPSIEQQAELPVKPDEVDVGCLVG